VFEAESSKKTTPDRGFFSTNGRLEAGVASAGAMLNRVRNTSFGQTLDYSEDRLTKGETAVLRFLTAVELIESDLWQQYDELGGTTTGAQNNYQLAFQFLNRHSSKYITANAINEIEHVRFLTMCLESEGIEPSQLDEFRSLTGSKATGSQNIDRLTNLMHLNIDTNWDIRHRSEGQHGNPQDYYIAEGPTIPYCDSELDDTSHVQTLANTAALHFRYIEEGVSNLYASLSQRVKRAKVLRVTLGIGGQEIAHFLEWINFAPNDSRKLGDSDTSMTSHDVTFLDSEATSRRSFYQASPQFSSRGTSNRRDLYLNSVVRPMNVRFGSAVGTIQSFTENGLFFGQSTKLLRTLTTLAEEADAAVMS
jgi:hypothetical protein